MVRRWEALIFSCCRKLKRTYLALSVFVAAFNMLLCFPFAADAADLPVIRQRDSFVIVPETDDEADIFERKLEIKNLAAKPLSLRIRNLSRAQAQQPLRVRIAGRSEKIITLPWVLCSSVLLKLEARKAGVRYQAAVLQDSLPPAAATLAKREFSVLPGMLSGASPQLLQESNAAFRLANPGKEGSFSVKCAIDATSRVEAVIPLQEAGMIEMRFADLFDSACSRLTIKGLNGKAGVLEVYSQP